MKFMSFNPIFWVCLISLIFLCSNQQTEVNQKTITSSKKDEINDQGIEQQIDEESIKLDNQQSKQSVKQSSNPKQQQQKNADSDIQKKEEQKIQSKNLKQNQNQPMKQKQKYKQLDRSQTINKHEQNQIQQQRLLKRQEQFQNKEEVKPQDKNQISNSKDVKESTQKNVQFYCGMQSFVKKQGIPFFTRTSQQRQKLVSTSYGFDMYVDSKDYSTSNVIATTGTWQPHYINLIGHIVKPGFNVLNLGPQSGLEAIVMGKIIAPEGKLFIFQPYSFSYDLIQKNIQLNGLKDITKIYKIGASDKKQKGYMQIFYSNTGGSEIKIIKQDKPAFLKATVGQLQQVDNDKVDQILPKDIKIDFAFIDVEKMQVKALKGMKEVIDRSPDLVMMIQWQFKNNKMTNRKQADQLLKFLQQKGYKIYTYSGGDITKCTIGEFHQLADRESLFRVNFLDIFLFPKTVPIPKST